MPKQHHSPPPSRIIHSNITACAHSFASPTRRTIHPASETGLDGCLGDLLAPPVLATLTSRHAESTLAHLPTNRFLSLRANQEEVLGPTSRQRQWHSGASASTVHSY